MSTLIGTDANDWLDGGVDDDTITGLGGEDHLFGRDGSDYLDGGDGTDYISGGPGNDIILGGTGDDVLWDQGGDDSVDGGSGNDIFYTLGSQGNDTLLGASGDDYFLVDADSNGAAPIVIDGGDGADLIEFYPLDPSIATNAGILATGGAGVDTFRSAQGFASYGLVITDFAAGAGGDLIDLVTPREAFHLADITASGLGYTGGNPFDSSLGYLRLIQNGADAELQYDEDGATGTATDFRTAVTLQNVDKDTLTADNFAGGLAPDGSFVPGKILTGTTDDDNLPGSYFDDTINGLDGEDYLTGSAGNDYLDGGDGSDYITGGLGSDTILGGADDDQLIADDGPWGEGGEDGDDWVDGGSGNDFISASGVPGNDTLLGGAGDDYFFVEAKSDGTAWTVTIDGGDGADRITFNGLDPSITNASIVATGGAGVDTFHSALGFASYGLVITDFAAGASGDLIDVVTPVNYLAFAFSGLGYASGNPFNSSLGYLRLNQNGADAELQYDEDGAAGTDAAFRTTIIFQNLDKNTLTSDNFVGGIDPDGSSTLAGMSYFWNEVAAQGSHAAGHVLIDGVTVRAEDGGTSRDGTTSSGGTYSVTGIAAATTSVTATQAVSAADKATVTLDDALEVLRLNLGKLANPSPYQYLASDFNADNKVTLTDALEILKSVLNIAGAPESAWVFVREEADVSTLSKDSAPRPTLDAHPVATDPSLNLVAVLRGDANGSWKPAASASYEVLPDEYFINETTGLVGQHPDHMSPGQFGL